MLRGRGALHPTPECEGRNWDGQHSLSPYIPPNQHDSVRVVASPSNIRSLLDLSVNCERDLNM